MASAPSSLAIHQRDALARLFAALTDAPYAHDFFAVMRRIDALQPQAPRLSTARRLRDEPLRLGQDVELDFAPAAVSSFEHAGVRAQVPRLGQRFFGLFGPMGPMPLHLTEFVRERQRHHGDPTAARFADVLHHRMLLLFFRTWAQAQPCAHLDRPGDDAFSRWVGSLAGVGIPALQHRDTVPDSAKRFHAAALMRSAKSSEGLTKVLSSYFQVPVQLEPHVGHWLPMHTQDRTRLGLGSTGRAHGLSMHHALGQSAMAGSKVWNRQSRYRLHLGPLTYAQYETFLPGQPSLVALRDWQRQYHGLSLSGEVVPVLQGEQVPRLALGQRASLRGRLGQTAWLGTRKPPHQRSDLRLRAGAPLRPPPNTTPQPQPQP
jgi:type VI secretion system protein ImpH